MSELGRSARKALDAYLRRVAEAMRRADHDADEVEAVREGLREQILELATRDGAAPGRDAIERAIASLDGPESYAPAAARNPRAPTRGAGLARLSALSCVAGAMLVVVVNFLGRPEIKDAAGGAFVISQLVALAAGGITWRDPWGRFGAVASALLLLMLAVVLVLSS